MFYVINDFLINIETVKITYLDTVSAFSVCTRE